MKMISLLFTIILLLPQARAGGQEGNGGDIYSIEFTRIASRLVFNLRTNSAMSPYLEKLTQAIEEVSVESTMENLFLNGIPKDAINYPREKRIVFHRRTWLGLSSADRPFLVLHEYLGVAGFDDNSYKISNLILKKYIDVEFALAAHLNILQATRIFPDIVDQGNGYSSTIRLIESVTNERTSNDRLLIIGLPGASDWIPYRIDTLFNQIDEITFDGISLIVRGLQIDIETDVSTPALLQIQIKEDRETMEFLETPIVTRGE